LKTNISCCTKSIHSPFSLLVTSYDLGEGLEIGLDHLLARWLGVGELHGDEPVLVVAPLEEDLIGGDMGVIRPSPVISPCRGRGRRRRPEAGGDAREEPAWERRGEGGVEEGSIRAGRGGGGRTEEGYGSGGGRPEEGG